MVGTYVSRAGEKLQFAIEKFNMNVNKLVVADFGSSTGGFVDVLLKNGASKVYAVETAYGELDWNLRKDNRVVVMEKTNAMHITLPEKMDLITVDVGWTKQEKILPNVIANLKKEGKIITLIKPHYESPPQYLRKGKLMEEKVEEVLLKVKTDILRCGLNIIDTVKSPILGDKGKNTEFLSLLTL